MIFYFIHSLYFLLLFYSIRIIGFMDLRILSSKLTKSFPLNSQRTLELIVYWSCKLCLILKVFEFNKCLWIPGYRLLVYIPYLKPHKEPLFRNFHSIFISYKVQYLQKFSSFKFSFYSFINKLIHTISDFLFKLRTNSSSNLNCKKDIFCDSKYLIKNPYTAG